MTLYTGSRLDLAATGLGVENFPAEPWLTNVEMVNAGNPTGYTNPASEYYTITWYELHYDVLGGPDNGGRRKRCYVLHRAMTQNTKPFLFVGFPGSNASAYSLGAYDLVEWTHPTVSDTQFHWPVHLIKDHDVFAVLIDGPDFGAFTDNYPASPNVGIHYATTAMDSLIDDICGVNAARWFLANLPHFQMVTSIPAGGRTWEPMLSTFVAGMSWGAVRASFLATALKDCTGAYISGSHMSKANFWSAPDMQPSFAPPEWSASFDYPDMIKNSRAMAYRIAFGGLSDYNLGRYTYHNLNASGVADPALGANPYLEPGYTGPDASVQVADILASSSRFSKHYGYTGHAIDLADIRQFFTNYFVGTGPFAGRMRTTLPELPQ